MTVIRIPVTVRSLESTNKDNGQRQTHPALEPMPGKGTGPVPQGESPLASSQSVVDEQTREGTAMAEAAQRPRGPTDTAINAQPASEPAPEPGATDVPSAADVQAEMAAFRRRTEARMAQQAEEEKRRLLRAFLEVADNLERALGYGTHLEGENPGNCEAGHGLHQGVELTYRALQRMLAQEGVEPIEAVGQPFDPHLHQALLTTPAEASPGTVIGELERGYRYRGELLRPASVQVAQ
jgi:molecular chaperone GrpE